jgi:DNA-directed RNA polymerase subunit RPC12/RpoP
MSPTATRTPQKQPAADAVQSANKTFQCQKCKAKLEFQPGLQALKCPYCGTETEIPEADLEQSREALERQDYDAWVEVAPEEPPLPPQQIKCPTCKATSSLPQNITSDRCGYCGAPAIATDAYASRKIKPTALAPFVVQQKEAKQRFATWVKSLWFAPSALQKLARIDKGDKGIQGVYVPFFTYDADTVTHYSGERGTVYYDEEEVEVNGKRETRRVERVEWHHASGTVDVDFEDMPIVAALSLPVDVAEELEPWELDRLVPFADSFVAGMKVEAYQQGLRPGFERAQGKMEPAIRSAVEQDIGGDRQRIHRMDVHYNDKTFRHVLLPIWAATYKYSNKTYRFLVNGQTGLVKGERPWSWVKISLAVLGALTAGYLLYRMAQ